MSKGARNRRIRMFARANADRYGMSPKSLARALRRRGWNGKFSSKKVA